jgi:oligopeptide transport system substrate-binding protein
MVIKRLFLPVALLIILVMILSACSPKTTTTSTATSTTSTSSSTTTTSKPASSTTTTSTTTSKTSTTTSAGGTVFTADLYGEPETIDPNKASWATQITVIRQCFVGLLGFKSDLSLEARAAKEIPTKGNGGISQDGLTYTFQLRNDVTWSDGKKVTAQDYVYSIKRTLSPEMASEYASFYYDIEGGKEYNAAASADAATKEVLKGRISVWAINDYMLQIRLKAPRPTFLQMMALWPTNPVREDIVNKFGDKWTEAGNYIGNGPFILSEWVHQDHLTFVPNPNYWGAEKPKVSKMILKDIEDQNAAFAAYRNNELDMCTPPGGTEKATMADPVLSKEILRVAELTTFGLLTNVTRPPFDNKLVRQALSCAVDRVAYVDKVRGGVGAPAISWIPPGMPGYDPKLGSEFNFNPAKAKQLLAQAGYPDPSKLPSITFSYSNSSSNPVFAQFLQGQLKDNLGINIKLDPIESKAYQAFINAEKHQLGWTGWGADYPDPDNWLPEYFGTEGGNNHMNYSSAQFDALAEQAKYELDNTKRLALWDQAQKIVVEDQPIIFMYIRERFWLVKPWVKGLVATGMDGGIPGDFFFYNVSISK